MNQNSLATIAFRSFALVVVLVGAQQGQAQDAQSPYPTMAPLDQYLMERNAEIALSRSAAPESISADAEIMVLKRTGYEAAVKGTNGFVCLVERSWFAGTDDPEFWNPKLRAPICFNAPAARSQVPLTLKRTELALEGQSKAQISDAAKAAREKQELPTPELGAMCYMMSKQGYLSDRDGHWRPHLMFFVPETDPRVWGAGLSGSPIIAFTGSPEGVTVFLVPLEQWSDGTPAPSGHH
jgi:hypothetical protein